MPYSVLEMLNAEFGPGFSFDRVDHYDQVSWVWSQAASAAELMSPEATEADLEAEALHRTLNAFRVLLYGERLANDLP